MQHYEPTRRLSKVTAGTTVGGTSATLGGALVMIVVWLLETYAGAEIPAPIVAAITTVVASALGTAAYYLASYFTPLQPGEIRAVTHEPRPAALVDVPRRERVYSRQEIEGIVAEVIERYQPKSEAV